MENCSDFLKCEFQIGFFLHVELYMYIYGSLVLIYGCLYQNVEDQGHKNYNNDLLYSTCNVKNAHINLYNVTAITNFNLEIVKSVC